MARPKNLKPATTRDIPAAEKKARTTRKPVNLQFGQGLRLIVRPTRTNTWLTHYWVQDRNKRGEIVSMRRPFTLGWHPTMSVEQARTAVRAIRDTVRAGGNPGANRGAIRAERQETDAETLEVVAKRWVDLPATRQRWSEDYHRQVGQRLARHVFPTLGSRPIASITTQDVADLINPLWKRVPAQTVLVQLHMANLFDYAVRHNLMEQNPVRRILKDLPKRPTQSDEGDGEEAHARVETIADAQRIINEIEASGSNPLLKLAHRLITLTAVRKLEGLEAEWTELSEDLWTWTIPARRMKGKRGSRRNHIVTLSPQARDVVVAARQLAETLGITSKFVFPGSSKAGTFSDCSMNDMLNDALARLDMVGQQTIHGWRGLFSTTMNDRDIRDRVMVDIMLSHKVAGLRAGTSDAESPYNGARYLAERRRLWSDWAALLMAGMPSAFAVVGLPETNVVQLQVAA